MSAAVQSVASVPPDIPGIAGAPAVRHAHAYYWNVRQRLHAEMAALIEQSRLGPAPFYLQQHRHKSGGQENELISLRWRLRKEGKNIHILWSDAQTLLPQLPVAVARHYEKLNRRVVEVNTLGVLTHQSLRALAGLIQKRSEVDCVVS